MEIENSKLNIYTNFNNKEDKIVGQFNPIKGKLCGIKENGDLDVSEDN